MAWRDSLKVYARCPVHARFNPTAGPGAIKAGCNHCAALIELYREFVMLKRRIQGFNDVTAARRKP
jgi:protein gp37